jgi:hypothetical protein
MCTSPGTTFAWVGTILINVGFISLISWGATTWWPIGFVLSGLYTIFLWWLAAWLEKGEYTRVLTTESIHDPQITTVVPASDDDLAIELPNHQAGVLGEETTHAADLPHARPQLPILASILYGLALISMGVTGSFIPANLFCQHGGIVPHYDSGTWTTNISSLPSDNGVQQWATQSQSTDDILAASFVYMPASGVTLFSGTDGSYDSRMTLLWSVDPQSSGDDDKAAPKAYREIVGPNMFTRVTKSVACFVADDARAIPRKYKKTRGLTCFDGIRVRWATTDPIAKMTDHTHRYSFLAKDGILWFKENPSDYTQRGVLIFSLDPETMVQTLHSQPPLKPDHKPMKHECNPRLEALGILFLTALPILIGSILLWIKKKVSSMGVLTYIGATLVYASLCFSVDHTPGLYDRTEKWWFTFSGLVYMLVLVYLLLMASNDNAMEKNPMRWGISIGGFAFVIRTAVWILHDGLERDTFWGWLLLTCIAFVPVTILGVASDSIFLVFLGAAGLFADSARFAQYLVDSTGSENNVVPIQFVVLSLSGVGIGALGVVLTKHQDMIRDKVVSVLTCLRNAVSTRRSAHDDHHSSPDDQDALLSDPLVPLDSGINPA